MAAIYRKYIAKYVDPAVSILWPQNVGVVVEISLLSILQRKI